MSGEPGGRDPWGPFRTEDDARNAPGVQDVHATRDVYPAGSQAWHAERGRRMRRILDDAFEAAGVVLGDYDRELTEWLGCMEPQTVATVARWVRVAFENGRASGGENT